MAPNFQGMNSPWIPIRIVSWVLFIGISFYLLKKHRMTQKTAFIMVILSVLINGFLLGLTGSMPNPVQPISSLLSGNFNILFIIILIVLLAVGIFLGRLFCGYACPVGAMQESLWRLRTWKLKNRYSLKIPNRIAQIIRGAIFIISIVFATLIIPAVYFYEIVNPFEFYSFNHTIETITFWITISIFIFSLFTYRPYCRLICPFGLLANLTSRIGVQKWQRTDACTDCGACEKLCPSDDLHHGKNGGECYMCGRCSVGCPKKALDYSIQSKPKQNTAK